MIQQCCYDRPRQMNFVYACSGLYIEGLISGGLRARSFAGRPEVIPRQKGVGHESSLEKIHTVIKITALCALPLSSSNRYVMCTPCPVAI